MNLAKLAHQQKQITYAFFGLLILQPVLGPTPLRALLIVAFFIVLFIAVRMMITLEMTSAFIILGAIGLLVPLINLIVLVAISHKASTVLRQAGIRVGPIGVSDQDIERIGEITGMCTNCWKGLTDTSSGYCSDCGHRM